MARDRLAALRAQQQANYSDRWSSPPNAISSHLEPTRPPTTYAYPDRQIISYGEPSGMRWSYPSHDDMGHRIDTSRFSNPNIRHHTVNYSSLDARSIAPDVRSPLDDMTTFYSEISFIQDNLKTFNDHVSRISDLHSRSLNSMDWASARRSTHQLDGLVKETGALSNLLKERIKNLHTKNVGGRDGQIRKQQTGLVKQRFVQAIQNYQQVEQAYRTKYKQRMERQLRVVKPDATSEEVKAVVNDDHGGQLFTQMLQSSSRYGASRAAFREVQDRHEDVKRIERTLSELAQLFNDMNILVMRDGEALDEIEAMAIDIEKHAHVSLHLTDKAVSSARARRRRKWICIGIILIILACFGIAIGVLAAELNNGNNI